MARSVHLDYPQQGGIACLSRASRTFGKVTAIGALLLLLSLIGSLLFQAAARIQAATSRWAQHRRELAEDRQLWELAQKDPGVMADLVALNQQAPLRRSHYF